MKRCFWYKICCKKNCVNRQFSHFMMFGVVSFASKDRRQQCIWRKQSIFPFVIFYVGFASESECEQSAECDVIVMRLIKQAAFTARCMCLCCTVCTRHPMIFYLVGTARIISLYTHVLCSFEQKTLLLFLFSSAFTSRSFARLLARPFLCSFACSFFDVSS